MPSEPPPFWQNHAQQKQSVWQSAANQVDLYLYGIFVTNDQTNLKIPPDVGCTELPAAKLSAGLSDSVARTKPTELQV